MIFVPQDYFKVPHWVVFNQGDKTPVFETSNQSVVDNLDADKFGAMPLADWLNQWDLTDKHPNQ